MGKKLDKVVAVGTQVGVLVGLWDRVSGWFRKRRAKRLNEKQLQAFEDARELEHNLNLTSDDAAMAHGEACPEPDCQRPKWHSTCHCERPPCPGGHGIRLRSWGSP